MPITLSQSNSVLQIDNNTAVSISAKNGVGTVINALSVGSTGMVNYVPYVVAQASANPNSIDQCGGIAIYNQTGGTSSTLVATPFNNVSTDLLSIGTYCLVGSVDVSLNAVGTVTSWGVFFDTSSNLVSAASNGTVYSISRNYVLNATTGITSATRIQKQTTLTVNLSAPTTIYLNYYARSSVGFTSSSTIVACRIG